MPARSGQSAQKHAPPAAEIPDRLYYRIGDVARACGVEPYVLRFWETQFPQLKPNKGGTGQRLYRRRELDMALRIKSLVYEEGYTLAGARQSLENTPRAKPQQSGQANQANLALSSGSMPPRPPSAGSAPNCVRLPGSSPPPTRPPNRAARVSPRSRPAPNPCFPSKPGRTSWPVSGETGDLSRREARAAGDLPAHSASSLYAGPGQL